MGLLERRMAMLKNARLALCAGIAAAAFTVVGSAHAQTSSDESAAILVWPRVVYDSQGVLFGVPTDTLLNISSTATGSLKQAHCYMVNATSHCSNNGQACLTSSTCDGGTCEPRWNEIDFNIFITQEQPLGWLASEGMSHSSIPIGNQGAGRCSNDPGRICISNAQCPGGTCQIGPHGGQSNIGTGIPPVPEDPFIGAITCIQYDPTQNPPIPDQSTTTNALIGEATIFRADDSDIIDSAKYNAVGFLAEQVSVDGNTLRLGGNAISPNYAGCAGSLILNHYFDGATDPMSTGGGTNSNNGETATQLTLVPCGNNFLARQPGSAIAQFLVFNEFEQRFSASTKVDCVYDR
jgi:hypothetical protein